MKILCAVDGSEFARWGVEALGALSGQSPDTALLLHVTDTTGLKTAARAARQTQHSVKAIEREATRLVERMAEVARTAVSEAVTGPRTRIQTLLASGPVADTIVRQASRKRVDLIVMGCRGLSDIQRFLLGSVSRRVVSLASSPVLVVKRPIYELGHVVLAVDGSKSSRAAAVLLGSGLLPLTTRVTVISVVPPVLTDLAAQVLPAQELDALAAPARQQARETVTQARELLIKEGLAVLTDVLEGPPGQSIVRYLEQANPDLVVVGSRGLRGVDRVLLGSVSEAVVKHAPCSVLVVRPRSK